MEWSNLSILNANIVGKEVDTAINLLRKYYDDSNPKLTSLVESMRRRSEELEVFFGQNDDDQRAVLFEKERMKLRKALQTIVGVVSPMATSSKPSSFGNTATSEHVGSYRMDLEELRDTEKSKNHDKSLSPTKSMILDPNFISHRAVGQSKSVAVLPHPMTKKLNTQIYAWEGGRELRGKIQVDENSYVPTSVPGVYVREDGAEQPGMEKWLDVKVVLTQEELTTLAARKKAMKRAKNLGLSSTNFVSVQSSTPYIDPSRIMKETYRPDQPDKWILPVYHNK